MDQLRDFTTPSYLPIVTLAVRLVVATVLGAMIGVEREWRRRPAGLARIC